MKCQQKFAHFILVKTTYKGAKLVELYITRIVCLHGVPKKIVSDRTQFTLRFWEKLHEQWIHGSTLVRRITHKWMVRLRG
jgi:hypothetical protein